VRAATAAAARVRVSGKRGGKRGARGGGGAPALAARPRVLAVRLVGGVLLRTGRILLLLPSRSGGSGSSGLGTRLRAPLARLRGTAAPPAPPSARRSPLLCGSLPPPSSPHASLDTCSPAAASPSSDAAAGPAPHASPCLCTPS
jgi:hypothetical protein